ncbi:hypothetical protein Desac_1396 [Desulfobacca acetoxidans DSM 11109]|uniref:Uncharacterized protein n=1 Tax=Desulfobacca acetoxidans (strain ATCC 700848 / DSM 11109 / ASRB2) TaxID=880072 RepID=F2NJ80_DESAR|nr:hypothetical protein Desac_1396 [Desulfobacca acetoxidans DSM 11109]
MRGIPQSLTSRLPAFYNSLKVNGNKLCETRNSSLRLEP